MKLRSIEFARFRLPLAAPLSVANVHTSERVGRVVRIRSEDGAEGFGEVTPLPGLHAESLRAVDDALDRIGSALRGREFDEFAGLSLAIANQVASQEEACGHGLPSVAFGLETAGMGLFAHARGVTPSAVLAEEPRPRVRLNGWFQGGLAEARARVADGSLDAFDAVKVKVGRRPPEEDRRVLEVLLAGLPERTRLRLDANRALDLESAVRLFRGLPPERVEYVEEPLGDPAGLADLNARTGLWIALDESLLDPSLHYLGRAPYVRAWVIKPARIGHWQRIQFFDRQASHFGAQTVISSCMETGLGLWAQVQMAAALPGDVGAAGLATDRILEIDLVEPPYDSSAGRMETSAWQGRPSPRVLKALGFSGTP